MYFIVATAGLILVGLAMYSLLYNQFITPEKAKESVTQTAVQIPASLELIIWGFLLNTPRSNARNSIIRAKKEVQTIIKWRIYRLPKILFAF